MAWKTLTVLALGLLIGADDAKKDAKDQDENKIQGTWVVVSVERDGQKASDEEIKDKTVTFAAESKVTVKMPDKEINGKYKIDAGKKPKHITLEATSEKTLFGIYKLDGDNLTICCEEGDMENRPTEFASKGSDTQLIVLKREKK
jgi:uncharacterized protein (TIGR03067 family)